MRSQWCALVGLALCVQVAAWAQNAPEIPKPKPLIPQAAWASALKEHPRLLGPRSHLRALAAAKPREYQEIRGEKSLLALGIVHAVQGLPPDQIQPFIQAALQNVARGVTNVHQDTWLWLMDVALTFDLFHDAISPSDRQKMIDWMNAHLGQFTADENAFHNSTLSKILCYLRIAYATWGENSRAQEFRDYALVKLYEGKVAPVLREFGAGGGYTECGWYTRGSLWHLVDALETARRFEDYDGFQQAPQFFYQRLAYEMLQPYPGLWVYGTERYAVEGDGSDVYGGHTEYPRHTRTVLAQYFRGSELAAYVANKRRKGSNGAARLVDFLYDEQPDTPRPIDSFPLAHLAAGIGKVYARSDWSDNATWFRFECGDYWNAHQHYEVGNFEIYRYAPLATESGEYTDYVSNHSVNWLIRTIAHNSILVYQPAEQWTRQRDGGRNPYANDGGQTKKWEWPVDSLAIWKQRRDQFERGRIIAYENCPEFLYVAGDCTKAYSPTKLSLWIRQIVFLRPGAFVIFDRVVSTRPDYEKTWLLHCRSEPSIQGNTTTITQGKGVLTVRTLLPEQAAIHAREGYTYRGQTFNEAKSALTAVANRWRIEVSPASPATEDLFLHVLFTDQPRPTKLLRQGDHIGVAVGDDEVLFTGQLGGQLTTVGKTIPLRPAVVRGKYE
ncbi:MAG TPA: hypothetical protein VHP11_13640 [Tepidisphaeraceae bacterium]|nr:hypothetical protein [Tepidisphaeraceae bacterium]